MSPGLGTGARMTGVDYPHAPVPAFLFDLDGTLVDSVYQHLLAWREALEAIYRLKRLIEEKAR